MSGGTPAHTEATMLDLIGMRFFNERYVMATKVNDGAGFSFGRTLDAIVFDTWPSEGLQLHGFEVKVSTADFRRELQDTRKSAAFICMLDTFSIAAPKGVVDKELLPPKWGLYVPDDKGGLRAVRKPLMLHDGGKQETADRSLMAAFCRALMARGDVGAAIQRRVELEVGDRIREAERRATQAHDQLASLRRALQDFEATSGIILNEYSGPNIGEAVRLIMSASITSEDWRLRDVRRKAEDVLKSVDAMTEALRLVNAPQEPGVPS